MAEFSFKLDAQPTLGGIDKQIGNIRIVERSDLAMVSVATPLGGEAALSDAVADAWGLEMPSPTLGTVSNDTRAVQMSADQIFVIFPHDAPDAARVVGARLGGVGYVTDQTDAWVALEVSGPDVGALLERLSPVDLSPAVFPVNASARTTMEHMSTLVIRTDTHRFLMMSASSSAGSFLHAIEVSAHYV